MRNLLALLAATLLAFAGLGYYLDWYSVGTVTTTGGRHQISIDIDGKKVVSDLHRGAERGAGKVQDFLEGIRQSEEEAKSKPLPPAPTVEPLRPLHDR